MATEMKEIEIAHEAINMVINNEWRLCEELLTKHKDKSPLLSYCFGFLSFIKSIFLFEDAQIDKALKDFDATQRLCKETLKRLTAAIKKNSGTAANSCLYEEKIACEILIADAKLFSALLTLMKQDVTLILTSGIFELRRSWKMYQSLQKYLFNLFKTLDPNAEDVYGTDPNKLPEILIDTVCAADDEEATVTTSACELSLNSVKNLLASVSFGYGIIQICFSFLQPNLLKVLKFIGFEADRNAALKALFFTSQNKNIRSAYADMIIVMYSSMYVQMCGTHELDMHLNYNELNLILDKNLAKTPHSCMFLLFKAKNEFMHKDIDKALETYLVTHEHTAGIRELETLAWYEMGLIYLTNLNYELAFHSFTKFTSDSKWSFVFNVYLMTILNGCLSNFSKVDELLKSKLKLSPRKNPIEIYSLKRIEFLKKATDAKTSTSIHEFLCLELVYLWCCIPYAKKENLVKMLDVLYVQTDKTVYPITSLIEASIRIALGNKEFAEELFKESLSRIHESSEKNIGYEKYVVPFAYFNLGAICVDNNQLDEALNYLNKLKNFKDYDHEDRLMLQVRTLNRRIDYKKSLKA